MTEPDSHGVRYIDALGITARRVLKTGVTTVNPYVEDMPASGDQLRTWNAMGRVYTEQGEVFEGRVDEWVRLAVEAGLPEYRARGSFSELERLGMLSIDDHGFFTPTPRALRYFDGQEVKPPQA